MKKNLLWMLAAILACGSMFTSCSKVDSPVEPEPPVVPDQATMFVQNVLADGRYTPIDMGEGGKEMIYLRLDVADYEEAKAEFMKLLPEGVAETAFEVEFHKMFEAGTGYKLYAPQQNDIDSIAFLKVQPLMTSVAGIAWVTLTSDMVEALHAHGLIFMQASSNDDMDAFITALMGFIPYCMPDPEDPTHLICNVPSKEVYMDLVTTMLTSKMLPTTEYLEDGNMRITLSDKDNKSYGKLTVLGDANKPADAINVFLFDEDLQASMAARIGGAFAKLSFYLAPAAE